MHTGDSTNSHNAEINRNEFMDFISWYSELEIENKIYVAGNHDSYVYQSNKAAKTMMKDLDIIYLEDDSISINDIKFYGTPWTPQFGSWYFMRDRSKMINVWKNVARHADVLLTHGPPQGILDLTMDWDGTYKLCGDSSIHTIMSEWKNMKYMCFGHIHDYSRHRVINYGQKRVDGNPIIFVNSAGVEDGRFDKGLIHNGHILEI